MFEYSFAVNKIREFFLNKGFVEVPTQSRLSILAACEDPKTVGKFEFTKTTWPLPQTGQMWLEYEMMKNPGVPGVFCIATSYRDEENPIPGRHDRIFPMLDFESHGGIADLRQLEMGLLDHLGFSGSRVDLDYEEAAKFYDADTLEAEHELKMVEDYSSVTFLTHFPQRTHPFWNMKQIDKNRFAKIDVILHGMETIGSAERSSNVDEMRRNFYTVSDGQYAKLLFGLFGKKRVEDELNAYLNLPMIPRFGGGIGITRMIRALKAEGLIDTAESIQKEGQPRLAFA